LYGVEASESEQRGALVEGEVPVAVYGLGKMGLPLAGVLADVTGNVTGVDIDPEVVEAVNAGECHVKNEPGLAELVAEQVDNRALSARREPASVAEIAAVQVVIVPTLVNEDKQPDLSILRSVTGDIGDGLSAGDLVVIESTVPPRTCVDVVWPLLVAESGLSRDEFGLAFCPERTSSGRALEDIRGAYPKVVGGVNAESTRAARLLYEEVNAKGVITTSDATTAEAVKVFEGLYRDVNIALGNELAKFTDEVGIDVREAIKTANTQPFCNIHDPGPGVGGHCIPYYPYFMIRSFETAAPLLLTVREVNDSMPEFTVARLQEHLHGEGTNLSAASVLILGLTYRPGVEEISSSPAIPIARTLSLEGATVHGTDPMLEDFPEFDLEPLDLSELYEYEFDGIVLVTMHKEFEDIRWSDIGRESGSVVIDGRDSLSLDETHHVVYTIGRG
jgi:UDP-N-acetyl-D-mannosaminuronic acid dehydrogenase